MGVLGKGSCRKKAKSQKRWAAARGQLGYVLVADDNSRVSQPRRWQQETSDDGLLDPDNCPQRGKEVCCVPGCYSHQV